MHSCCITTSDTEHPIERRRGLALAWRKAHDQSMRVRNVPWLLALVALGVLLVVSSFRVLPLVLIWLLALALLWAWSRRVKTTRRSRIVGALVLLPILFLLAFEGGWWLIPADLAWLAIELIERRGPGMPA
jgi:energy-coupling factor transporter transmembrane protein EcfT